MPGLRSLNLITFIEFIESFIHLINYFLLIIRVFLFINIFTQISFKYYFNLLILIFIRNYAPQLIVFEVFKEGSSYFVLLLYLINLTNHTFYKLNSLHHEVLWSYFSFIISSFIFIPQWAKLSLWEINF